MKYHIVWNDEIIASFQNAMHRNQILVFWHFHYAYASEQIIAKDD